MSKPSLNKAQVVDWCLELIPVWEVPVTVGMLRNAHPEISIPVYTCALKQLTELGVLRATPGEHDQTFYFPPEKEKVCDIQEIICKGVKAWSEAISEAITT